MGTEWDETVTGRDEIEKKQRSCKVNKQIKITIKRRGKW